MGVGTTYREPRKLSPWIGGPSHGHAAEQVKMEVIDTLTSIRPGVVDDPEASIGQTLAPCHLCRGERYAAQKRGISLFGPGVAGDVLARNDEDMNRGLRVDVPKRHHVVVFVHHVGTHRALSDLAEEAIIHHQG